jgi:hypothetical protein
VLNELKVENIIAPSGKERDQEIGISQSLMIIG